jgi:hypothetical protein
MSAAATLIQDLRAHGVELQADGDRLRFRPASAVTPDLRERLAAMKPDVLAALERLDLRRELADIIRESRRGGDPNRAADALEQFRERASIMQFDAGLDRHEAERCALADVLPGLRRVSVEADPMPGESAEPDPLAGLVNPGWTPTGWRDRLRQLADACEAVRPDLAGEHRANANRIDAVLGRASGSRAEVTT